MPLIIIDFDDTLIDNTKLDLDSFHYVIKNHHLKKITDTKIIRWRKNGMLAKNILNRLKTKKSDTLENCVSDRLDYLKKGGGGVSLITLREGVKETLEKIKKMKYFVVVVTSRENKTIVKKTLHYLKIEQFIGKIYSSSDYLEIHKNKFSDCIEIKTQLYKLVLKKNSSKIDRKKVIVVGNLKADIIAANKLKLSSIAIKGSYRFDTGISNLAVSISNFNCILNYL